MGEENGQVKGVEIEYVWGSVPSDENVANVISATCAKAGADGWSLAAITDIDSGPQPVGMNGNGQILVAPGKMKLLVFQRVKRQ